MSKADQIYDKVRLLPDSAQPAVLTLVESLADETSSRTAANHEPSGLARTFRELAEAWRGETSFLSFMQQRALHPAYQRIIGMGPRAVPLLLARLAQKPAHWFWALHAITGADPVPQESQGNLKGMTTAWLAWGAEHGYR